MHMLDEIRSQPDGIRRTVEGNRTRAAEIKSALAARGGVDFALLIGRGTSDNAATYAKYLLALVNGLPAGLAAPSLMNLYEAPLRLERVLTLALSQSGETDEVVQAVRYARSRGSYTLAVTNEPGSTLAREADATLSCLTGREQSVPATKTYTGELAVLALLSATLAGRRDLLAGLHEVPGWVQRILDDADPLLERRAERYRFMDRCLVLGRGLNFATALEASLKLKETCLVGAEALSAADFLHGPIAALPEGHPVLVFAPQDSTLPAMELMIRRLAQHKAELLAVSDHEPTLAAASLPVRLPPAPAHELFWPLGAIVPAQLLCYHLARVKGLDPDRPSGLSKVTHSGTLQPRT